MRTRALKGAVAPTVTRQIFSGIMSVRKGFLFVNKKRKRELHYTRKIYEVTLPHGGKKLTDTVVAPGSHRYHCGIPWFPREPPVRRHQYHRKALPR